MKEDFLHYVWKFQKFNTRNLFTSGGELIQIITPGQHNYNSGPDFFSAQIRVAEQLWAGNVEIHLKSSDWYTHNHEQDSAYDNVILHVVWEHDSEIFRKDNSVIPTMEIKEIVKKDTLENYRKLFSKKNNWINCENKFSSIDSFLLANWLERLYFERLEDKAKLILIELNESKNHWDSVLFRLLAKNFGLKVNGDSFFSLAKSLKFSVIKKCSQNQFSLEALFFGQAGFFSDTKENAYFDMLANEYKYLKHKFNLNNSAVVFSKFFRLRPPNFPTIRLSQLAVLYSEKQNLFSEIISANSIEELYKIFDISASDYWDTHYNFGVSSPKRKKKLSTNFIDLLIINTVIPLKFCYSKKVGKDISDELLEMASCLQKEENTIIKKFNEIAPVAENALQSQALIQLKNEYCTQFRCLECAVGNSILKG